MAIDQLQPHSWNSRSVALLRHGTLAAVIILNLCIIAIAVYMRQQVILLPSAGTWQSRLPALAAGVGNIIAGMNGLAMALLVTAYMKRRAVRNGVTLESVNQWSSIATGGVPLAFNPLLIFAVSFLIAKAFLPSPLVGALTPTSSLVGKTGTIPLVEFSSASGIPGIKCEYGLTYGYGAGCPMNNHFGEIYDAGLQAYTDSIPVNYTRNGVTYPSELSGISGVISDLSQNLARVVTNDQTRKLSGRDVLKTCVARSIITTKCSPTLRAAYTVQSNTTFVDIRQPKSITEIQLFLDGTRIDQNTSPDYGYGIIVAFGRPDRTSGVTSVVIASTGNYPRDLGSATIDCTVSAEEEIVPIQITGGQVLEKWDDGKCPQRPQPDPTWLGTITYLGQMALQKQQGQDGRLEVVQLLQNNGSKIEAMERAITRMVAVGATEAYATLFDPSNTLSVNQQINPTNWTYQQSFEFATPRLRLGSNQSLLWLIPPAVLSIVLAAGWVGVGFSKWGNSHFDPLSAASMAIAGMNHPDQRVPAAIRAGCVCHPNDIKQGMKDVVFRYGVAAPGRLGLIDASTGHDIPPPTLNQQFGGGGMRYVESDGSENKAGFEYGAQPFATTHYQAVAGHYPSYSP